MNFWILFLSCVFVISIFYNIFVTSDDDVVPACSLDDIRYRLKNHCGELKLPPRDTIVRRRRHYAKNHLSVPEPKPIYFIRFKKSKVHFVCCTPKYMKKLGPDCMEFYTC